MDSISEIMEEDGDELSKFQKKSNNKNNDNQDQSSSNPKSKLKAKAQTQTHDKTKQKDTKIDKKENKFNPAETTEKNQNLSTKLDKIAIKLDRIISLLKKNTSNQEDQKERQAEIVDELEGVFDGQYMIGSDTNKYEVPYNFANEKNLVEGDLLKLKIKDNGSYSYKVIEAVKRKRLVGPVKYSEKDGWIVQTESDQFKLREDFIKQKEIEEREKVVILVPKHGKSNWGTVENVF